MQFFQIGAPRSCCILGKGAIVIIVIKIDLGGRVNDSILCDKVGRVDCI
jgi:hypothetical protein